MRFRCGCNAYKPADQGWGRARRPVIKHPGMMPTPTWHGYREDRKDLSAVERGRTGICDARRDDRTILVGIFDLATAGDYGGQKNWNQTLPVDSFHPNRWGLYRSMEMCSSGRSMLP